MKRVLVMTGDGINCENESARAFQAAGAQVTIQHVNFLLRSPHQVREFQVLCFPGGFSFGDELKSGKILAEKLRQALMPEISGFLKRGGLMIGICNGFQVLMQLGVFGESLTLTTNDHQQFRNYWVECLISKAAKSSPWFRNVETERLVLPVRHKEGRIMGSLKSATIALQYDQNINGSTQNIAGLLDSSGQILGLMPHPEAATHDFLNPLAMTLQQKQIQARWVRQIFEGAIQE